MAKQVKLFGGKYAVGQIVALRSIDTYGCGSPARRIVNADGSPRAGLTRVRVVALVKDDRRLTLDNIRDGARNVDYALAEVL